VKSQTGNESIPSKPILTYYQNLHICLIKSLNLLQIIYSAFF